MRTLIRIKSQAIGSKLLSKDEADRGKHREAAGAIASAEQSGLALDGQSVVACHVTSERKSSGDRQPRC
jgi:hypothetical protein